VPDGEGTIEGGVVRIKAEYRYWYGGLWFGVATVPLARQ